MAHMNESWHSFSIASPGGRAYLYVYIYLCMCVCVCVYMCVCVCVYVHGRYVYMGSIASSSGRAYLYKYIYIYMCVYIYIHVYLCIYMDDICQYVYGRWEIVSIPQRPYKFPPSGRWSRRMHKSGAHDVTEAWLWVVYSKRGRQVCIPSTSLQVYFRKASL